MEVKLTWIEKLMALEPMSCIPLGDTPPATIYSAIHYNKETIKEADMKFRVQTNEETGENFACRIK